MKYYKISVKLTVLIGLAMFFLTSFFLYKGIPTDLFGEKKVINVDVSNSLCILNGYVFENGVLSAVCDDANITIDKVNEIRTICLNVEKVNLTESDGSIQIFFSSADEEFSEKFSIKKQLKEGNNKFVLPYHKNKVEKIRIDIGNFQGESVNLNKLTYTNKFDDIGGMLGTWIISTMVILSFVNILLNIKSSKEKFIDINIQIYESIFYVWEKLFNELKKYIINNIGLIISVVIIGIITFGAYVSNYTLSIDEENVVSNSQEYLTYFSSGRFSLAILINIFSLTPYFNTFVACFFLCISAVCMCMLFEKEYGKKIKLCSKVIFVGIYMSMPYVIGETFNFAMQGMWIALGYILTTLSVYLISDIKKDFEHKATTSMWTIFFAVIAFGIYQSFTVVFVYLVFLLILFKINIVQEKKEILNIMLPYIEYFGISAIIYAIINWFCSNFIASPNGYLEAIFVGWNKHEPNDWVLQNVWSNWYKLLTGQYFNMTAGNVVKITVSVWILYLLIDIICSRKDKRILKLVFNLLLLIIPFAIPLCLGTFVMLGRSLNAFPVMLGIIWFIILNEVKEYKIIYKIAACVAGITLVFQIMYYNRFVYIDQLRYKLDSELATQIMHEVRKIDDYQEKGLVFISTYDFNNPTNLYLVSGCESFFAFQEGDNTRILNFLSSSGYGVKYPTDEQIEQGKIAAENMTVWPKEGSICDMGDIIVIKLGETN